MLELKYLLQCPVDWVAVTGQPEPHDWLEFDWYKCIIDHAVSSDDSSLASEMAQYRELLDRDLDEQVLANLKMRRESVLRSFEARSKRLSELKFLSPSYNGKHFKPGLSDEQTVNRSMKGPSLYFEDFSIERISNAFWTWFQQYFDTSISFHSYVYRDAGSENFPSHEFKIWDRFLQLSQFRVACNCLNVLGVVKGVPTNYVAFDVSMDARIVHCYPVTVAEAETIVSPSYVLGVRAFPFSRNVSIY